MWYTDSTETLACIRDIHRRKHFADCVLEVEGLPFKGHIFWGEKDARLIAQCFNSIAEKSGDRGTPR